MIKTKNIIGDVQRTSKKYNILTFNTHERYQSQLAKTGHNFYAFMHEGAKDWYSGHAPMPENYYVLPKNSLFSAINFDFILSNSKFGQFQISEQINRTLQIPVISLEHTLPLSSWPDSQMKSYQNMKGDIDVFITKYSMGEWGMGGEVVYHSIDTELFRPDPEAKREGVLTVAHDFKNRDYALNYQGWERITKDLPRKVVGETEGLSKQSESVEHLVEEYQNSLVYINPSTLSPVPTSMLEAMSCGCAVVTTATCEMPNIINNGENGFISNDEEELRGYIQKLLADPELAKEMGESARETIKNLFSEDRFIEEWNTIFNKAYEVKK
ncbi:MAG: glycosyltransferase family 4 protein [SAR202 cluster bacterium]|nr:glycosyltransferase family 4 protein [SAR202 cluster bacterium]|tara:strand:- start:16598 stop:17575 length:978 start_codon:yes stop_codon:yes gene_type:complete